MMDGSGGGVALVCGMTGGAFTTRRRRGGLRQNPPLRTHAMRKGEAQTIAR